MAYVSFRRRHDMDDPFNATSWAAAITWLLLPRKVQMMSNSSFHVHLAAQHLLPFLSSADKASFVHCP